MNVCKRKSQQRKARLLTKLIRSSEKATRAVDDMLAFVAASKRRIRSAEEASAVMAEARKERDERPCAALAVLRGSVLRYDCPTEPVAKADWNETTDPTPPSSPRA